jgi:hypothetical protein
MKTVCHYTSAIKILETLHSKHPKLPMGKHLATALDGYGDMFLLTDQEIFHALKEYSAELASDVPHEEEIDKIYEEGLHLERSFVNDLLDEQEDE